jgi:hypothetical protein
MHDAYQVPSFDEDRAVHEAAGQDDEREKVMTLDIARLLPRWGEAADKPPDAPYWFLVAIAAISTVRSLIHLLAPDGGAHSIAGVALDGPGGANVVAVFAQWGASQLVLAIVYWVAILRYPMLTLLMLAIIVIEQLLRLLAGTLKPLTVAAPPPGTYYTYVLLPTAVAMLVWSLCGRPREVQVLSGTGADTGV